MIIKYKSVLLFSDIKSSLYFIFCYLLLNYLFLLNKQSYYSNIILTRWRNLNRIKFSENLIKYR